jgi:hypothetical protein
MGHGGYSQNILRKFVKIAVTLGLNTLKFFRSKVFFSKQISVKVDVINYKSNKTPIFYVELVLKSILKLQRF